jgi:hypothetical protein
VRSLRYGSPFSLMHNQNHPALMPGKEWGVDKQAELAKEVAAELGYGGRRERAGEWRGTKGPSAFRALCTR